MNPGATDEPFAAEVLAPLRTGARVALLGTAGPPVAPALDAAVALVREWGLEPVVHPSARAEHPRAGYLTGPDQLRADDFAGAWGDDSIEAIFCVRGGYGTVRMLDLLDIEELRAARPKPVFGSSDVTALHEFLADQLQVPSWFTPMLATRAVNSDEPAREMLRRAVFEGVDSVALPTGGEVLVPGTAEGRLIGGNLSLLAMTLSARTRRPMDNTGTIAVLEDIDEETYRLDGFLTSLLRAGWFEGVRGIILGSWVGCNTEEVRELCNELLAPLGVPMVWDLPIGHCDAAASVPLGLSWRMELCAESATIVTADPDSSPRVANLTIK